MFKVKYKLVWKYVDLCKDKSIKLYKQEIIFQYRHYLMIYFEVLNAILYEIITLLFGLYTVLH